MFRVGLLASVSLLWCLAVQAQTTATCAFSFFSPRTQFKLHNGTPVFMLPLGINDFGTIVGAANPGTAHGLIRWSNGGVIAVKGTTLLTGRNDHGTSVGYDSTDQGVQVDDHAITNDHTITPIVLDVNNGGVFEVKGINKWGPTIGRYAPHNHYGAHGFKRWRSGTTHTLDFPGAQPGSTEPNAINDNQTVVGSYFAADDSVHGFIFNNGKWGHTGLSERIGYRSGRHYQCRRDRWERLCKCIHHTIPPQKWYFQDNRHPKLGPRYTGFIEHQPQTRFNSWSD